MENATLLGAIVLGLVEGLTEFIPVSSTGHLILLGDLIGFQGPPGRVFEVAIQFGAILAICWVYRAKLFGTVLGLVASEPADRRFAINVLRSRSCRPWCSASRCIPSSRTRCSIPGSCRSL